MEQNNLSPEQLQALSSLVSRNILSGYLGMQYGTSRDLYEALGYKTNLYQDDYFTQYGRQDIAAAIIDRPAEATWYGDVDVYESDKSEETQFEKDWEALWKKLKLKDVFTRLDKITGLGEYGVLLLGFSDVVSKEVFEQPVSPSGGLKLLYVKPVSQNNATITTYEDDPKNPRYGMPRVYQITIGGAGNQSSTTLSVHHTRVLHVVDGAIEDELLGTPRLMKVFNRLMDIEKLSGGSAEMFWRGARPGYQAKVAPDFQLTSAVEADLKDQINEYEHNLRRILVNQGIDMNALNTQVSDPGGHLDIQLQLISAATNIPKRILTGSERGELASSDDADQWAAYVTGRRDNFATEQILKPFINLCVQYKIIAAPSTLDYTIEWTDLFTLGQKEQAEVGKIRADAIKAYIGGESVLPVRAFLEICLGLTAEQIEMVESYMENEMAEEPVIPEEPEENV